MNVFPQWFESNNLWTEVEDSVRSELARNSYSRRVVVSGTYGTYTLPDKYGKEQPLYLVMPQKQVGVPLFLWKLLYDADDNNNSIVFICRNKPNSDSRPNGQGMINCDRKRCPRPITSGSKQFIYCCDIKSFEREFGKFDPSVFKVPSRANIRKGVHPFAPKHVPPASFKFTE